MDKNKIPKRESQALINSMNIGVVPRIGLRHIAVGRKKEVNAFLNDMESVADGGASFRLVAGVFGSGKSFLLQMIRNNAMEKNFVVMDADLSPERRLIGSKNNGLATYRELMQHVSTKSRDDGALEPIIQKWIKDIQTKVAKENDLTANSPELITLVSAEMKDTLDELSQMNYGFAFSNVIDAYWRGIKTGDDELKQSALKWLRGEFTTKTEAKKALGVDTIIADESWYEFLKLFASFVQKIGYKGLLIFLDEGVNLYKIPNKQSREANYEKLLTILNDTMQGKAKGIGVFFSGTEEFIYDERRGIFSYEALKSRLVATNLVADGYVDYSSPIIKLNKLSDEELFLLLERLSIVHSMHYKYENKITDEDLQKFLNIMYNKSIGANKFLTTRDFTRNFFSILNIMQQNEGLTFNDILKDDKIVSITEEKNPEALNEDDDDIFKEFEI